MYNMDYENLCIFSYNSRGFDSTKQDIVKTLQSLAGNCLPIICNQENFLLKANEYVIKRTLPDYHVIFKPASKEGLTGRPKNGMFVAVPDCLKDKIKDLSPASSRIQCILIDTDHCKVMLLNTYFPTDPRCANFDETEINLLLLDIPN